MSRLAVKDYFRRQMALLDIPVPCAVLNQRPKEIAVGDQAVIVINIAHSKEVRFTMPRTTGNKKIDHQVRLDLFWVSSDEQDGGNAFDQLLEQVDGIFRAAPMPESLTDPESGAPSTLLFVGEDIETAVNEPLLDESLLGMVVFTATKIVLATELTQG